MIRAPLILAGLAALMGAAGVALAAAGVHANGGELAQRARFSSSFTLPPRLRSPRTLGSRPPRLAG